MRTASIREEWEGRTIHGRFPLLEWLGGSEDRSVFLTVLQGIQTATIKLIPASHSDAAAYLAQWERAKALSHPHLVQILQSDQSEIEGCELVYVVTERAEETLSQIIPQRALDAGEVREILDAVLDALSYIHAKGFVHGHVKPSNILLIDGDWKLSGDDVTVASEFSHRSFEPAVYDAPELVAGDPTAASDIWSLGMTLAEAMTQHPLAPDHSAKGGPIVPESVPQPFLDIVRGCTRFDPAQRCNIRQIRVRLADEDNLAVSAKPIAAPVETTPVPSDPIPVVPGAIPVATHEAVAEDSTPVASGLPLAPEPAPAAPDAIHAAVVHAELVEPEQPPELFPRPLFSNIEEESRKRRSWSPVVFSVLILLAVAAVFVTRNRWMKPAPHVATESIPAPVPAPSTPTPTSSQAIQTSQQPAVPTPSQAQPTSAAQQPAQQSPLPTASESRTQTAPATHEATPAPQPSESKTPKGGPTEGAVAKRVLPKASPSASRNIRGSVKVAVRVAVNRSGTVSNAAYLTRGPGNYFARISLQAARSWKFQPPRSNGHPKPSTWTLEFSFWPEKTEANAIELR